MTPEEGIIRLDRFWPITLLGTVAARKRSDKRGLRQLEAPEGESIMRMAVRVSTQMAEQLRH